MGPAGVWLCVLLDWLPTKVFLHILDAHMMLLPASPVFKKFIGAAAPTCLCTSNIASSMRLSSMHGGKSTLVLSCRISSPPKYLKSR